MNKKHSVMQEIIDYLTVFPREETAFGGIIDFDVETISDCEDRKESLNILRDMEKAGILVSYKERDTGKDVFNLNKQYMYQEKIFPRYGKKTISIMGKRYYLKIDALSTGNPTYDSDGVVILACDKNYANAKPLINIYHGGHITTEYFDISPFQIIKA